MLDKQVNVSGNLKEALVRRKDELLRTIHRIEYLKASKWRTWSHKPTIKSISLNIVTDTLEECNVEGFYLQKPMWEQEVYKEGNTELARAYLRYTKKVDSLMGEKKGVLDYVSRHLGDFTIISEKLRDLIFFMDRCQLEIAAKLVSREEGIIQYLKGEQWKLLPDSVKRDLRFSEARVMTVYLSEYSRLSSIEGSSRIKQKVKAYSEYIEYIEEYFRKRYSYTKELLVEHIPESHKDDGFLGGYFEYLDSRIKGFTRHLVNQ